MLPIRSQLHILNVIPKVVQNSGMNQRFFGTGRHSLISLSVYKIDHRKNLLSIFRLHLFDQMQGIIFFASLSGYNLVLEEDGQTNRVRHGVMGKT